MEPHSGRTSSKLNMDEGGRHNMLSALPPPPMPLGVPYFNQSSINNPPYGHLAPLPRKADAAALQPLPPAPPPPQPPPRPQPPLDITRTPLDNVRNLSPLPLDPVRPPQPLPQPEPPRRAVQTYRKRQHEATESPFDFGAWHVPGMLAHPDGDIPNLPPRSGTGMRLRPARLPPCSCIPPPYPELLVPIDSMLPQVLRMHDQRRLVNPSQVANVVVFDCIERPPRSSESIVPTLVEGAAAAGAATAPGAEGEAQAAAGGSSVGTTASGEVGGGGSGSNGQAAGPGAGGGGGTDAGSGTSGGRVSGEGSQPRGAAEPDGSRAIAGGGTAEANGAGEASLAGAGEAAAAASRGAAGPASCSYTRTTTYDYFEDMPAWYTPRGTSDDTLVFESRYESGNLRRAVQVYPYEYDLILRPDINTRGHTQWFFFSVTNTRAGCRYKFNIINLLKEDSLYNDGMRPLVHSAKAQAGRGLGWHRAGSRISYYANTIRRGRSGKTYYTLTFTLTTEFDNDLVHVAHCYPYTYTDLQRYIRSLELDPLRRHQLRRETLATSLAGNAVDVLTITSPTDDPEALKRRKGVVVSARVHPGESNASWMMKGVLDFLMGPSLDARILRDAFVFKIIPMLNPDGVITGNYRCSLAGVDLNRVWNDPSRKLHPVIHATKLYLKQLLDEREVVMFCDLHGHSRKRGVFMYGCEKKMPRDQNPAFPGWPHPGSVGGQTSIPWRFQEKLLPLLIQYNAPDLFSYQNCSFKVQKSKSGTSRVVGFRELGLINSFTVEASFAGPISGRLARQHFTTNHLEQQGAALMMALLDYWDPDAYGLGELLGQLDFMHPANGEAPPKFITTVDGQLLEAEDDEPPTDSDDESSDDGTRGGAAGPRTRIATGGRTVQLGPSGLGPLARDAQGASFMQQYYSAYGMANGSSGTNGGGISGGGGALLSDLAGGPQQRGTGPGGPGDKVHSDSEMVMDPKKAKRRARLALQRAQLKAEQAKATEGLAACLPMMAALQVQSPTNSFAAEASGNRALVGGSGGADSRSNSFNAGSSLRPGNGPGGGRGASTPATPHAIEYAKQRGVYRGDAPQWTVPGLNAAYDMPEGSASGPPSPLPQAHRPQSPHRGTSNGPLSGAGPGRLSASTNAFNALLYSQPTTGGSMASAATAGGGGGSILSTSSGAFATSAGPRGTVSPLPLRTPGYILPSYGSMAALAKEDSGGSGAGADPGVSPSGSSISSRLLNPLLANAARAAAASSSGSVALGAGSRSRAQSRPRNESGLGLTDPGGGGGGGEDGQDEGPASLQAIAAAYSDPERLRKDREALELRVTEAVLSTSPLFQRL
ncbi:hypothetical protein Vretimale_7859 [Volvox reticuliferus]|uniref:Peptidase M14 domain-containing protein n=1 Tax=Volvox reticuliferus TaxID=1737510 RepID=A0A8J4G9Q9_9CHLO|nr:hypothetical protein Vretifemale_5035 [Volvox reticuliferus]GIM03062.1 hypothetical protein Vretimale_7859 [Volvox reticuliferus]